MSGYCVDHLVIRVPDPEDLARRVSDATRLPVLRGWTPDGTIRSRGVRFANAAFLDIFEAEEVRPCHVGVRGEMAEAARLAAANGWQTRNPEADGGFPWTLMTFRRGQGALSAIFVVDYDRTAEAWGREEFSGELYAPFNGPGARLRRVDLTAPEDGGDPAQLGLTGDVEVRVSYGTIAEVVRLDVAGGARNGDLRLTPRLTMHVTAAQPR